MKLNDLQLKAALHFKGPMLVLAGPGSGKTTVIVARILQLINQYRVDPSGILVITFTKAAARTMKERFLTNIGCNSSPVTFSTLHSLFYKILSFYTDLKPENILSESDKQEIIEQLIKKCKLHPEDKKGFIKQSILNISSYKSKLTGKEDSLCTSNCGDYFEEILNAYNEYMKQHRLLDFDDLILYCYRLLNYKPEILEDCRKKFRFILVDEFQDVSLLQYKIIRMIAHPENNLFAVGDDDQSIYSFRGADPEIMLNFPKDYPDARVIQLNLNYRSGSKIVTASERIIQNNKHRFSKNLTPVNREENDRIFLIKTSNLHKQNEYILNRLLKGNISFSSYAILSRTNKEHPGIVNSLMYHNIPFVTRDSSWNLFNTMVGLDLSSYMEAALQLKNEKKISPEIFLRIMNKPVRYIERSSLKNEFVTQTSLQRSHITKYWAFGKITSLFDNLKKTASLSPVRAINYIYEEIGYRDYLTDCCQKNDLNFEEMEAIKFEISDIASNFEDWDAFMDFIRHYEERINQNSPSSRKDAVTVSTFHSSKGLEFDHVIIVNCVNGITPYIKSGNKAAVNMEEERRLFYVALTRARQSLSFISPESIYGKSKEESLFLQELIQKSGNKVPREG